MDAVHTLALVTTVWGMAMAVSPMMQIRTMLRTRRAEDVSLGYFGVMVVGFVLWGSYGVSIGSYVLALPNVVSTVVGIVTIGVAMSLRRAAEQEPARVTQRS